jgi:membrane-associated phospholipid phosphatase
MNPAVLAALEKIFMEPLVLESELLISLAVEVTALGSTVAATVILAGLWQLGDRETARELFLSLFTVKLFARGLKALIARPRPPEALVNTFTYSFPSEHAATAFLMASILGERYPHLRPFFYTAAVVVSLSRLLLGVHYPTDILAGAALGLGVGYAVNNRKKIRKVTSRSIFRL